MGFRFVSVDSHCKLEYELNHLVCRKSGGMISRVLLDEIHTLLIESTEVVITAALVSELCKRKIKVIFCDNKRDPICEISTYYGAHNGFRRIHEQIAWGGEIKGEVWKQIIQKKILHQAKLLEAVGKYDRSAMLKEFAKEVCPHDSTNREGHAAKVYFNSVFHEGFVRESGDPINAYLNYGYKLVLSQFNRVITSAGYLTQLGIHHVGETNPFNFSCDLMEPFRPYVDAIAKDIREDDLFKERMQELFNLELEIDGKRQTFANAIQVYAQSIFSALSDNAVSKMRFPIL